MGYLLDYSDLFIKGTKVTILLSIVALCFGFVLGLIACIAKISNFKIFKVISNIYIEVIRDTPLMVQLSIIYFGLPTLLDIKYPDLLGLGPEFTAGAIALTLNSGAYIAEILRSGIESVNKGQMEASRSLGMNYWQSMRYVIVPQAIKNILPALANEFVSLVKETAIVSTVGIMDIMFVAGAVKNTTFKSFGPYLLAALIYFVLTFVLSRLVALLEKKMAAK